jgi:hypothetical protein
MPDRTTMGVSLTPDRALELRQAGALKTRAFAQLLEENGLRQRRQRRPPHCLHCGSPVAIEHPASVQLRRKERAGWMCDDRCALAFLQTPGQPAPGATAGVACRLPPSGLRPANAKPQDAASRIEIPCLNSEAPSGPDGTASGVCDRGSDSSSHSLVVAPGGSGDAESQEVAPRMSIERVSDTESQNVVPPASVEETGDFGAHGAAPRAPVARITDTEVSICRPARSGRAGNRIAR